MPQYATTPHISGRACRLGIALALPLALLVVLMTPLSTLLAFDEESGLTYSDPTGTVPVPTTYTVSSVHFDLVGALAIAAGFSEQDADVIQIYSQLTDKGVLPRAGGGTYSFTASSYPTAPDIADVMTDTHCPSPSTTENVVGMGSTALLECEGCFTSRFGPYSIFFHEPHYDRDEELGAIEKWAFGDTTVLTGVATFGYSGTVPSPVIPPDSPFYTASIISNIYESYSCFVTETVQIDTGDVQPGSLQALGVYLHSLGDAYSHRPCIEAADAAGKPFAAHVVVTGTNDPLWDCRWTSHEEDFGGEYADKTHEGILAIYEELVRYGEETGRAIYHAIPITAENNYIANTLHDFAYDTGHSVAESYERRRMSTELGDWARRTRALDRTYWLNAPIEVCTSGCAYSSIGAALTTATAGDTVFVHPGIYTETITLKPDVNLIGTPIVTVIEGAGSGPVVQATDGSIASDTVFAGFTVRGGNAADGAGLYIGNGASPSLLALVVAKNSATRGGGMYVDSTSAPRLEFSTFFSNTATNGAGLFIDGANMNLRYTAFEVNKAGQSGGALVLSQTASAVYSNTFVLNSANTGGALYVAGGRPTIETNLIAGANAALNAGGGITIDGGAAVVRHNRIVSNTAGVRAAGVQVAGGATPTILNNLLVGNRSGGPAGGISVEGSAGLVGNNTIVNNDGDGIYLIGSASVPSITDNIVADNSYGVRAQDAPGNTPAPLLQHNDMWNNTNGDLVGDNVISQEGDNLSADPRFVVGPLGRYYLAHTDAGQAETSPLFDAGSGSAGDLGLHHRTVRTDNLVDTDTVDIGYHYPVAPPAVTRIYSATGGVITFTPGITIVLEVPPDVLTETTTFEFDVAGGHPISETSLPVGASFSIEAYGDTGAPITIFGAPLTLTIQYSENDAKRIEEQSLQVFYWDEETVTWHGIPATSHDTEENIIIVTLDHLTEFIVLGQWRSVYLPLVTVEE